MAEEDTKTEEISEIDKKERSKKPISRKKNDQLAGLSTNSQASITQLEVRRKDSHSKIRDRAYSIPNKAISPDSPRQDKVTIKTPNIYSKTARRSGAGVVSPSKSTQDLGEEDLLSPTTTEKAPPAKIAINLHTEDRLSLKTAISPRQKLKPKPLTIPQRSRSVTLHKSSDFTKLLPTASSASTPQVPHPSPSKPSLSPRSPFTTKSKPSKLSIENDFALQYKDSPPRSGSLSARPALETDVAVKHFTGAFSPPVSSGAISEVEDELKLRGHLSARGTPSGKSPLNSSAKPHGRNYSRLKNYLPNGHHKSASLNFHNEEKGVTFRDAPVVQLFKVFFADGFYSIPLIYAQGKTVSEIIDEISLKLHVPLRGSASTRDNNLLVMTALVASLGINEIAFSPNGEFDWENCKDEELNSELHLHLQSTAQSHSQLFQEQEKILKVTYPSGASSKVMAHPNKTLRELLVNSVEKQKYKMDDLVPQNSNAIKLGWDKSYADCDIKDYEIFLTVKEEKVAFHLPLGKGSDPSDKASLFQKEKLKKLQRKKRSSYIRSTSKSRIDKKSSAAYESLFFYLPDGSFRSYQYDTNKDAELGQVLEKISLQHNELNLENLPAYDAEGRVLDKKTKLKNIEGFQVRVGISFHNWATKSPENIQTYLKNNNFKELNSFKVYLPGGVFSTFPYEPKRSLSEVLQTACLKQGLDLHHSGAIPKTTEGVPLDPTNTLGDMVAREVCYGIEMVDWIECYENTKYVEEDPVSPVSTRSPRGFKHFFHLDLNSDGKRERDNVRSYTERQKRDKRSFSSGPKSPKVIKKQKVIPEPSVPKRGTATDFSKIVEDLNQPKQTDEDEIQKLSTIHSFWHIQHSQLSDFQLLDHYFTEESKYVLTWMVPFRFLEYKKKEEKGEEEREEEVNQEDEEEWIRKMERGVQEKRDTL